MSSDNPSAILLFSGKRKSGKDYITEQLYQRLEGKGAVIIRLSGPIKCEYAQRHNLNEDELFSSSSYKENYRKQMISWSEEIRSSDHGYFIRAALKMYEAQKFNFWIVSDVRRRTDMEWFTQDYPHKIYPIRITASEDMRKARGYVFTPQVDDAESECDLDQFDAWKFTFENDTDDESRLEQFLDTLVELCLKKGN